MITWGYDVKPSHFLSPGSTAKLAQHSETLLKDLSDNRKAKDSEKVPIIFVVHSLGGIVVKDALLQSKNDRLYQEIQQATRGVIFLGTPHRGAKTAKIGRIASTLIGSDLKRILAAIEEGSEVLERLDKSFAKMLDHDSIKVHCFQEELPYKGVMIVQPHSSEIRHAQATTSLLHAHHRSMTKVASNGDLKFMRISSTLSQWVEEIITQKPQHPEEGNDKTASNSDYDRCLRSLQDDEPFRRIDNIEEVSDVSYRWIFEDRIGFVSFLEGKEPSNTFWIQGKPASGKSTAMKYALLHRKTRFSLSRYEKHPWILSSFFFSNRGPASQKRLEGVFQNLLWKILSEKKHLFPYVLPTFRGVRGHTDIMSRFGGDDSAKQPLSDHSQWELRDLLEGLVSLGKYAESHLNICMFVDALDEHGGKHEKLLASLEQLQTITANPLVRLRICAASRPENIFKSQLTSKPGVAIHEHTSAEIERFVTKRMLQDVPTEYSQAYRQGLENVVKTILQRANGVFLWVRLVVLELVESIREGDTPQEMQDVLSTIPDELSDLYSRTIARPRRSMGTRSHKLYLESYIMFQLCMLNLDFDISTFLAAAEYLTPGRDSSDLSSLTSHQLQSRLYGRSYGLLEGAGGGQYVQYIHQTVREYVGTGKGKSMLQAHLSNIPLDSSNVFWTPIHSSLFDIWNVWMLSDTTNIEGIHCTCSKSRVH